MKTPLQNFIMLSRSLKCVLFFATLLLLASCQVLGGTKPAIYYDTPAKQATHSNLEQASYALLAGKYKQAEIFAQRALHEDSQESRNLPALYRIYAIAAANNKHPNAAMEALDRWLALEPQVDNSFDWQNTWVLAMRQLSSTEIRLRADKVWQDEARGFASRNLALVFSSIEEWRKAELGNSLENLALQHGMTHSAALKGLFEERLFIELENQPLAVATLVHNTVTEENKGNFPYAVFAIDKFRRLLKAPETEEQGRLALDELAKVLTIANTSLINGVQEKKVEPVVPMSFTGTPVVLALPLSGGASEISEKIILGAKIAQKELADAGKTMSLAIIDTDGQNWINEIRSLPAGVKVIGGPLRIADYNVLVNNGMLTSHNFITFLSRLPEGEEGIRAWRFFPSPDDQVNTLLGFANRLGINGFAILYPAESYGEYMSTLFAQKATEMGAKTIKTESYTPDKASAWLRSTGNLMATNANPMMANKATFRAIFLPDNFEVMQSIIPHIHYFGETRQLLLGSSLWGQSLGAHSLTEAELQLAVFPGTWNPENASPTKTSLDAGLMSFGKGQGDFWYALGYDFARFVSSMDVSHAADAMSFGKALQNTNINWSMAPISWADNGQAAQSLFLLAPRTAESSKAGIPYAPVDEAEFKKLFNDLWQ